MADDKDVLEIDLDKPEPKAAATVKPEVTSDTTPEVPVVADTAAPSADEALNALKKQIEDGKKREESLIQERDGATAALRQASDTTVKAQTDARTANLQMVTTALETLKGQQTLNEQNWSAAMSAQDFGAAAKIQSKISENAAKIVQLQTGKEAMEAEAKQPIKPIQPNITSPVEKFISELSLSAPSATWVRAHPQFATDPRMTNKMFAAHNLIKDDVRLDSPEYFQKIEEVLGLKAAVPETEDDPGEDPMSGAAAPVQRRAAPPAAPVTRSGKGDGKRPNVITLSAEEREMATNMGMSAREYAEQKGKLIKEGKLH